MYSFIPGVAVYLCHFVVGLAGSFEGPLHVNKIDHNTHIARSHEICLGVRFPYNPLHYFIVHAATSQVFAQI